MNSTPGNIQKALYEQHVVHSDVEIMSRVPVFVGTRVPLQTFFDYLEGEAGIADFLEDFPHLRSQVSRLKELSSESITIIDDDKRIVPFIQQRP